VQSGQGIQIEMACGVLAQPPQFLIEGAKLLLLALQADCDDDQGHGDGDLERRVEQEGEAVGSGDEPHGDQRNHAPCHPQRDPERDGPARHGFPQVDQNPAEQEGGDDLDDNRNQPVGMARYPSGAIVYRRMEVAAPVVSSTSTITECNSTYRGRFHTDRNAGEEAAEDDVLSTPMMESYGPVHSDSV